MAVCKSDSIIIVGAGAFGLSTALHLHQVGYTNITVLEKGEQIPSPYSAANDLNKIVRAEYEDPFYTDLTVKAINAWKTPLFGPYFHQTGFLHCVSGEAPKKAVDTLKRFWEAAEKHTEIRKSVLPLNNKQDIETNAWQLRDGPLPGWEGYFNRFDGYAHSAAALVGIHQFLATKGVRFLLGNHGAAQSILYHDTQAGASRKATGVKTASGATHAAELVIVAVGAAASHLVPQVSQQVVAKSWAVAHIQLTDEETAWLRSLPVVYARDLGFMFEPDPETNLLKICPMGGGYINTNQDGVSLPVQSVQDNSFLPAEDEGRIRKLLQQTLPTLAERPLVQKTLCWFADTSDSDFIIDYVPNTSSSVILLSGDSGHGFKMFPIFGQWVLDLLNATDHKQPVTRWRWKDQKDEGKDAEIWGTDVSWRLGATREYQEVRPSKSKL